MSIINLGQVVGVVTGLVKGHLEDGTVHQQEHPLIQVVNGAGETVEHPAGPHLQLLHVPEEAQGLMDSLLPIDGELSQDDRDLANWIRIFQHVKRDLADNGQLDQVGEHLAEISSALHLQSAAAGWAASLLTKFKGLVGAK